MDPLNDQKYKELDFLVIYCFLLKSLLTSHQKPSKCVFPFSSANIELPNNTAPITYTQTLMTFLVKKISHSF